MKQHTTADIKNQILDEAKLGLEDLLREDARRLLQQAIEQEVMEYIERHKNQLDPTGKRLVVILKIAGKTISEL